MIIGISGKIGSGKDTVGKMIQYLTTVYKPTYSEYKRRHIDGNQEVANPFFQNKKFADKLKDIVCILLGCTREQLEDRDFKEKELGEEWTCWEIEGYHSETYLFMDKQSAIESQGGYYPPVKRYLTPRKILQLMGTECGRGIIHPNIWVNSLMSDYNEGYTISPLDPDNVPPDNWVITDVRFPNEVQAIKDKGGLIIRLESDRCDSTNTHVSEIALDNYGKFDGIIDNNGTLNELMVKLKEFLKIKNII